MKRSERLLKYMENHHQDFLTALEGAVRLESPTEGDSNDLIACRNYFAELFRSIGFHVTEVKSLDSRFCDHLLMEYGKDAGKAAEFLSNWLSIRNESFDMTSPKWEESVGGVSNQEPDGAAGISETTQR